MTARAVSLPTAWPANLRRFDIRRDLLAVADLVEQCFADTLDADGRLYIKQMRRTARSNPLTQLASSGPSGWLPMNGFVWVEQGQLVGNLSLIEHRTAGPPIHLIANVAVHPQFRRRGIARALTQAALDEASGLFPAQIWLQVDENNLPAINLYRGMGFLEEVRRSSWRAHPQNGTGNSMPSDIAVHTVRKAYWPRQKAWLAASYPANVRWNLPFQESLLDPGWRGAFQRIFNDRVVKQWAAVQDRQLVGTLSWQSSTLSGDRLWLALPPDPNPEAIRALAQRAFSGLAPERELALNLPADFPAEVLQVCGFRVRRTLIWMRLAK